MTDPDDFNIEQEINELRDDFEIMDELHRNGKKCTFEEFSAALEKRRKDALDITK